MITFTYGNFKSDKRQYFFGGAIKQIQLDDGMANLTLKQIADIVAKQEGIGDGRIEFTEIEMNITHKYPLK